MRASVKEIYLQSENRDKIKIVENTPVCKILSKSCYIDTNRSGVIGSKNFKLPDVSILKKTLKEEVKNMDFYTAWRFLDEHKMFHGLFCSGLWTEVVKVNPATNEIDDDVSKNTKVQVWLEHGEYNEELGATTHDFALDCGGDTFEEAIIELAKLVQKNYTEDGKRINT